MKKTFALTLAILLTLSLTLAGCGGTTPPPAQGDSAAAPSGEAPPAPQAQNLILATGGTAGTYYPFGGAMAQIWNEKIPGMNVTAQSTGASVENLRLINGGEAEIAIVQNDVMDYAYNGTASFDGTKLENIASIATLYPEVVQIAATPESGIKSIADFKGKRISVGDAGSGTEFNAQQIMEAYGLTFNDIVKSNLSFKESGEGLQNGTLDACFITAGVPNAALQELSTSKDLVLIPIDDEHMKTLMTKYAYYAEVTIPKDTYKGMTEDVKAASIRAMLAVKKDMDEETVYNLTKALFENLDALGEAHAKGKMVSLDTCLQGISVPLHPGAAKYFAEKGLDVSGK